MLKHILTGQQPSATGSRHHNDLSSPVGLSGNGNPALHHHLLHDHQHHHHHLESQAGRGGRSGSSEVYDSVMHPSQRLHHPSATTPSSAHHHSLNHSQLSVNNLSQRLNHSHALNLSTLSTSKHSVDSVSPVVGNNTTHNHMHLPPADRERPKVNGGLDILRLSRLPNQTTPSPVPLAGQTSAIISGPSIIPLNASLSSSLSHNKQQQEAGVKEMLTSLGLLCLVSLLLALLSLIFLLEISPLKASSNSHEEYAIVYEVTLALCALALSLNLCCLLVCAIQFLFAVKLVKSSYQGHRTNKYLQKSSISRVCAVGGFFISIPVFLTGMILYTFIQFHSTPAIVTSVFIGLGIVFCGCAMVHNVFVWQREKTHALKALAQEQCEAAAHLQQQQQMQMQQQQQRLPQSSQHHGGSAPKMSSLALGNSTGTMPIDRGSSYHHHHHVSMSMSSPPLLLSSPAPLSATHNHHLHHHHLAGHRNVATPPTPPAFGDPSPPSPSHKQHSRSLHLPREASGSVSPGLPAATLDLSSATNTNSPHELSTLV